MSDIKLSYVGVTCGKCGHFAKLWTTLPLGEFTCPKCGFIHNQKEAGR